MVKRMFRNKETTRNGLPLAAKTAAMMMALYLVLIFAATWAFKYPLLQNYHEVCNYDEILSDLKTCRTVEPDSAAYVDGFNQAEAFRLMRYYRYQLYDRYKKYEGQVDIRLIRVGTENGTVISAETVKPVTPMMIGLPYGRNGRNIVFADSFNEKQVQEIAELAESEEYLGYIEDLSGYQSGRFFYPDRITFEKELDNGDTDKKTFIGNPPEYGIKIAKTETQDYSIYLPDGSHHGSYGLEDEMSGEFEQKTGEYVENFCIGENISDSGNYMWSDMADSKWFGSLRTVGVIDHIYGNDYLLAVTVTMNPWLYAVDKLKTFYPAAALLFIIAASALILLQGSEIGERLEYERRRRLLTDSLAHDMKTPLSVIRSYGELLENESDEQKRREYASVVIEESLRMNDRIVGMLDLSKMDAGTYPLDLSDFSVSSAVSEVCESLQVLAGRKGMVITQEVPEDLRLYADRKLIQPFAFDKEAWREMTHTFVVNGNQIQRMMTDSEDFCKVMESGEYIYADGHIVKNGERYVRQVEDRKEGPRLLLTDWANRHVDECCLRFVRVYMQEGIGQYVFGRMYYDAEFVARTRFYIDDFLNREKIGDIDDIEARMLYKQRFPKKFAEAFQFLRVANGTKMVEMADALGLTEQQLRRWLDMPAKYRNEDFLTAVALVLELPDWISRLLFKRAGLVLDDENARHVALDHILRAQSCDGIPAANSYLERHNLSALTY